MELPDRQISKFTFSGHDTFQCRHLWLKKGYEFLKAQNSFNDESAVVSLGVGKNMVSAISYWMKAFDLVDKDGSLTEIATYLLDDQGKDPYLEDEASLWLLHYHLIRKNLATTYNLIFNDFRREKIEFKKEHFLAFVNRKTEMLNIAAVNSKTVATDFDIFVKMYKLTNSQGKDMEDTFSGLLTELNLLKFENRRDEEGKMETLYFIENLERTEIPEEIILYCILNNGGFDKSLSLSTIEQESNSPGAVFALNKTGIVGKLESLASSIKFKEYGLTYSDNAGVKEIQIKNKPNPFDVLNKYYGA